MRHGQTFGYDGELIKIGVGTKTDASDLGEDWMLAHEMVHLSFPSVPDDHHWSASRMWADLARDMPKGVLDPSDKGLDRTHMWASTYWGGALFCFLADVDIRKQTHNQKGLQDALRGILDSGGDIPSC